MSPTGLCAWPSRAPTQRLPHIVAIIRLIFTENLDIFL